MVMMGWDFKRWDDVCRFGFSHDSAVFMYVTMIRPLRPIIELEIHGLRRLPLNNPTRNHEQLETAVHRDKVTTRLIIRGFM